MGRRWINDRRAKQKKNTLTENIFGHRFVYELDLIIYLLVWFALFSFTMCASRICIRVCIAWVFHLPAVEQRTLHPSRMPSVPFLSISCVCAFRNTPIFFFFFTIERLRLYLRARRHTLGTTHRYIRTAAQKFVYCLYISINLYKILFFLDFIDFFGCSFECLWAHVRVWCVCDCACLSVYIFQFSNHFNVFFTSTCVCVIVFCAICVCKLNV